MDFRATRIQLLQSSTLHGSLSSCSRALSGQHWLSVARSPAPNVSSALSSDERGAAGTHQRHDIRLLLTKPSLPLLCRNILLLDLIDIGCTWAHIQMLDEFVDR